MINKIRGKLRFYKKWTIIYYHYFLSKIFRRKYWEILVDGAIIKLGFNHPYQHMSARDLYYSKAETNLLLGWKKLSEQSNIILDIGGYNGMYGILSGIVNPKATIFIFEPDKTNVEHIKNNILLNNVQNVKVINSIVFNQSGTVNFRVHHGGTGGNIIVGSSNERVTSTTIDDWSEEYHRIPDLMKMDIEGAEYKALSGGIKTLERATRLSVLLEIHQKFLPERFGDSEEKVYELLTKLNYKYFYLDKDTTTTHCWVTK